ncbi:MAG: hypothetical protein JWM85_301, partial [Acidimicrobiaceae bacterium]|nr:hypothetical protein [Acidimicrobiaceae bacterium]
MTDAAASSTVLGDAGALAPMAIGADLGGTKLAAVLLDATGAVVHRIWLEGYAESYDAVVAGLEGAVGECRAVAAVHGAEVEALGLSVAGWLSRDRERLVWGANLGARDQDIGVDLRRRLRIPVVIENDGNATALAEFRAAGASARCFVLITLGTGVGGGVIVDGRPLVGANGLAAELGHLPVSEPGERCVCGGRGCLELVASGPGIARAGGAPTSFEIVDAARGGDPRALAVLSAAGQAIGRAVARLLPVVDPDL